MPDRPEYLLTIDLNTLYHLGIGLYSNIPAVISEVVANSWDADATKVEIDIDKANKIITIKDDGLGMTKGDINNKYLKVGYARREHEPAYTPKGRHVFGRKGIGKLSLFSIANTIEVRSVKIDGKGKVTERNGFVMNAEKIAEEIKKDGKAYSPEPVNKSSITIAKGTEIIIRDLKKGVTATEAFLKRRIARRFSVIGEEYAFSVFVNGNKISVGDRDYFPKIQYLWHIGKDSEKYIADCTQCKKHTKIDGIVDDENGYEITGWVGTFDEQKSIEEGNNTIVVMAWGKVIHEDLLKDLKEGGIFTKYLIGEIRADFLDFDDKEDIATSDRQSVKENDPRYQKLKRYVQDKILKEIQSKWRDWRIELAEQRALENPRIKDWFEHLTRDNKKYARTLFSKIESFPIEDKEYKKELYKHGIIAFETLALRDNLTALSAIDSEKNFELMKSIFTSMDELEAAHYWQITKGRVEVLKKFQSIVPIAKEKIIQKYIFDHLWLLDPSWERASTDARMEETVNREWKKIDAKLTKEEKQGRVDIRYRTAAGKHIVIELKKYDRKVTVTELLEQIEKYRRALEKCLEKTHPKDPHIIETICIIGEKPEPRDSEKRNIEILRAADARYITYDQLIRQTRESYQDYLDKEKEISRIQALIQNL